MPNQQRKFGSVAFGFTPGDTSPRWPGRQLVARGFTLIELMVVVSIITLLASMLVPALQRALAFARGATCFSHLHGIAVAEFTYSSNNNQMFPPSQMTASTKFDAWEYVILSELGGDVSHAQTDVAYFDTYYNGVYRCPADQRRMDNKFSYGLNDYFELNPTDFTYVGSPATWHDTTKVPHPYATVLYGELKDGAMPDHFMPQDWGTDTTAALKEVDALRHPAGANYAFVDGHAETRRIESLYNCNPPTVIATDQFNPSTAK